ncbi:hypothetical protein MPH_04183 [Macrophomina phaseolina MS6]|uniref:Uncharacterized protein n=1 Tax=Macrophomina phaseolina (strain MS6) TaxID=1126212 RepID=K2S0X0_MACPH|nr:hypothetical protein MPH_04183 [Macrophomina phaseolina MS6]
MNDIELDRSDVFQTPSVFEGMCAKFTLVYQTFLQGREGGMSTSMVCWKRQFATGDGASAGLVWGAKQGWSVVSAHVEVSTERLKKEWLRKNELAGLHWTELDGGTTVTCGYR